MIEIVHHRDPDGPCSITVFADGTPADFVEYSIDPGAGGRDTEFYEHRDDCINRASSNAVREALLRAFGDD